MEVKGHKLSVNKRDKFWESNVQHDAYSLILYCML